MQPLKLRHELPEDALAGFLPPNDQNGRGEGHVAFRIRPVAGSPTGTEIRNDASIVFDDNQAIVTAEWLNTLDGVAPSSAVEAIAPEAGGEPNQCRVSWSGSDDPGGSGLREYTIYVSRGGGPYTPWLVETTETSAVIEIDCAVQHRFYSVARDNVGNREAAPAGLDRVIWFPPQVSGFAIRPDKVTITWDSLLPVAGSDTVHDVVRGVIREYPVGSGAGETCLASGTSEATVTDTEVPQIGTGFWYLVRGRNSCGTGSYGTRSTGAERNTAACP